MFIHQCVRGISNWQSTLVLYLDVVIPNLDDVSFNYILDD